MSAVAKKPDRHISFGAKEGSCESWDRLAGLLAIFPGGRS
jgi:hypothetical protein